MISHVRFEAAQLQFSGRIDKEQLKRTFSRENLRDQVSNENVREKFDQYEAKGREHNGPSKLMKVGGVLAASTLLPGPQAVAGPLGLLMVGTGFLWKKLKGE